MFFLINQPSAETQGVWGVCGTHAYLQFEMRVKKQKNNNPDWHLLHSDDVLHREQKKLNISQAFLLQNKSADAVN